MDTSLPSGHSKKSLKKYQNYYEEFIRVTPQVEVFSLYIDKLGADDSRRRGNLYGTIESIDLEGALELYNRKRENSENIRANHPISLTGPLRTISSLVGFALNVNLLLHKDEDGEVMDGDDSEDIEISKWQLSWDVVNPDVAYITRGKCLSEISNRVDELSIEEIGKIEKAGYDKALKAVFKGQDGCCVTMYYAILKYAVQVWVTVDIIHLSSDENHPPLEYDVCGSLVARYENFDYDSNYGDIKDYCKTTLLNTGELGSVKGICGKRLELSRRIMALPAYSSLIIEADLWYNGANSRPKIANGKVVFTTIGDGYSIDYITGDDEIGIKVVVAWYFRSEVPLGDAPC